MNRRLNHLTLCAVSALIGAIAVAPRILFSQEASSVANAPINLRYVKAGEPGYVPFVGTTFLATNHTSKTIVANLSAIEVKAGTNWLAQLRPHGPLLFSAPGSTPVPGSTNAFTPGL